MRRMRWTSGVREASRNPRSPSAEHVERWCLDDLGAGGGDEVLLYCFEHGDEQSALVGEVVVERATGADGGECDDLLRAGVVVAALDEELAGGGDERVAGGFGALGDGGRGRLAHRPARLVDRMPCGQYGPHTACMSDAGPS